MKFIPRSHKYPYTPCLHKAKASVRRLRRFTWCSRAATKPVNESSRIRSAKIRRIRVHQRAIGMDNGPRIIADDSAIAVIQRLVKERQADISPYNLALTFEVLSRAHWQQGNTGQAIEDIHEGLRRFPSGWQADQLRKTLESYQKRG